MNYILKYKDINVLHFNTSTRSLKILNKSLLPFGVANLPESYDIIRKFCSDRILMMNREYCKEILTFCNIDDQSDINICITGKALSFRDNYWICKEDSKEIWSEVNLYTNKFSNEIEYVSLTGDLSKFTLTDNLFTGELTNKGTRAKCYYRDNGNLYLIKNEKLEEIKSEILTYYLAQALGLNCSQYAYRKFNNLDCSICQIFTSENIELVPCRDVMSYYNEPKITVNSKTYNTFYNIGKYDFLKMQLLDYIVLNVDRNRDNYGLLKIRGSFSGLFPIFDHDSCFKGKLENGSYFPSGCSFTNTLNHLKLYYKNDLDYLRPYLIYFKDYVKSNQFKTLFLTYKSLDTYNAVLRRIDNILD